MNEKSKKAYFDNYDVKKIKSEFFSFYHPFSLMTYFCCILLLIMFTTNPYILAIGLIGGMTFSFMNDKGKSVLKDIRFYLLLFVVVSLSNPIFSHNGETVLMKIGNVNVTFESLINGVVIALLIITVMVWCKNYSTIMTQDKFLFLFSGFVPKIALILSMIIRFIPLFREKLKSINESQKVLGAYSSNKPLEKIKSYLSTFSFLITWSLENSIETAYSMKSRGYGLKNKTRYTVYKFGSKDVLLIVISLILTAVCLIGIILGSLSFEFYPVITISEINYMTMASYLSFFILSFIPFIIETKENVKWKYYVSKI